MSLPPVLDLTSARHGVYHGDTWGPHQFQLSRILGDASIGAGDDDMVSATGAFATEDHGVQVVFLTQQGTIDQDQPAGLTIVSHADATHAHLSGPVVGAVTAPNAAGTGTYVMVNRRDITGATLVSQIRPPDRTSAAKATITGTVDDEVKGLISLGMAASVTEAIDTAGTFAYDVQGQWSSGTVKRTLMQGAILVQWDVTRP